MSKSPLVAAIAKAAASGPVSLSLGRAKANGKIAVGGAQVGRYFRVGSAPTSGSRVVVLRAGRRVVVFTNVTEVP